MAGQIRIPLATNILPTQSDNVLDLWTSKDFEILVDGPVNCAKSFHIMLYILRLHERYPNFQSLVVRNEQKTLHTTIVPQLFNKILRYHPKSSRNPFNLYGGVNRAIHLDFDNGGRMTFGGMDDSGKILGSEYDLIFYNQVEREPKEKNWTDLIGRCSEGRGGNWPGPDGYPIGRIIGDANPSGPSHWLMNRKRLDQIRFISFRHHDNPLFFYNGEETPYGKRAIADLKKRYSGYQLARMVYGEWVAASGIVYDMFHKKAHVKLVRRGDIPNSYEWFVAIDFGSVHASCVQLWASAPDGSKHIMFKEIYHSGLIIEELCRMTKILLNGVKPKAIYADHNAHHIERMKREGFMVTEADKRDKLEGIDLCKEMMLRGYNEEKPGESNCEVIFNRNSLIHPPDKELFGAPAKTIDEFGLYAYKEEDDRRGDETDEEPVKKFDNGMDTFRYYMKGRNNYRPYIMISGSANFWEGGYSR